MINFNVEVNLPEIICIQNTNRYLVEGWIFGPSRLKRLFIEIDGNSYPAEKLEIFRPEIANQYLQDKKGIYSMFSGFSIPIILKPVSDVKQFDVFLKAEFKDKTKFSYQIGTLRMEPCGFKTEEIILPENVSESGLLVICMATYNPEKSRFERQIESIIKQDYTNWICIVSDDCSDESRKKYMREILAKDPRFFFVEHSENVGFYHNFERCLEMVPSNARYVALSDQDDFWYPNKLSACLRKMVGNIQLVYCDMRIVHENGIVIADTYWEHRKNYYKRKDIDLLAIANTVTGAASVFRADLLATILPFPPRYGDVFHDLWIAIMAAASGGIEYVDSVLYDYIQNDENVIGHCDFRNKTIKESFTFSNFAEFYRLHSSGQGYFKKIKIMLYTILLIAKQLFMFEYGLGKHIFTVVETASVRDIDPKIISLIRRPMSILGLLRMHVKIIRHKETTNNIELFLLSSSIINKVYKFSIPLLNIVILKRMKKQTHEFSKTDNIKNIFGLAQIDPGIVEFKRKFSGRTFTIVEKQPMINILLSLLDPANFFGGYIGMFNLAKKFSEDGYSVRIILTDQKEIISSDLEKMKDHDPKLKEFFSNAEFLPAFSSEQVIPISKDDIFVATSWWTAHIANEAVQKTNYSKFIYFSQDYEPVFYEHGSFRVISDQSYKLNCYPIFSTDILQRYFIESGILKKENAGVYFKNPVMDFNLKVENLKKRGRYKNKLLFYGRPQPHAARNLYQMGCLAIDKAREMGHFQEDEWEVIGIGGNIGDQILPSGIKIKHIGKFNLKKYRELLPQHDLGLALMDSPHPSLLPIEMASAGLLVVTNTYKIKDNEYFSGISRNIKAVSPDYVSLANALIQSSEQIDDYDSRIEGSKVNWPHDWDEALPLKIIEKAIEAVVITGNQTIE